MSSRKTPTPAEPRIIIRGVHFDIRDDLRSVVEEKVARLFRHEDHIVRVRLFIEHDKTRDPNRAFTTKGHIEIHGPDLVASVESDEPQKSLDELIDKLDRMLRKRATAAMNKRQHPHRVELPTKLPKVNTGESTPPLPPG